MITAGLAATVPMLTRLIHRRAGRPGRLAAGADPYPGVVATTELRAIWATLVGTAGQLTGRRVAVIAAAAAVIVTVVVAVPVPTALQVRDWVGAAGPWVPAVFFLAHAVVTVAPFPRTVFTFAAGLLFGAGLGVPLAVAASTVSAVLALLLVRATGWRLDRLDAVVTGERLATLQARLRERGWAVVLAVRLIPAVPFSVINYAAGASAIRMRPYTVATVAGLTPGTAALVLFGDAVTGHLNPALVLVSAGIAAFGALLLGDEVRRHRRHRGLAPGAAPPAARAALTPERGC